MPLERLKAKQVDVGSTLNLDSRNWVQWSSSVLDAFLIAGTRGYIRGTIASPTDAADLVTWTDNDELAQANIRMNISEAEKDYLRDHDPRLTSIWDALEKRHCQTSASQTSLLSDALTTVIRRDDDMVKSAQSIRNKCKQIFEIGTFDTNSLASVIILQALHPDLNDIRRKHKDETSPAPIIKSLEKESVRCSGVDGRIEID